MVFLAALHNLKLFVICQFSLLFVESKFFFYYILSQSVAICLSMCISLQIFAATECQRSKFWALAIALLKSDSRTAVLYNI